MSTLDKLPSPGSSTMSSTIKVTRRTQRSIPMWLLQHLLRPFNQRLVKPKKEFPAGSPQLDISRKTKTRCDVKERRVDDIYLYEFQAKGGAQRKTTRRLLYFAGGGWQSPPSSEHWALVVELVRKLPAVMVTVVSYPLAPNSAAPVALPMLMKLYHTLLREAEAAGEEVILAGDSAGGNIALCLPLAVLKGNPEAPCPKALMLLSPSTDLRRSNPEIKALEKHDPLLRVPFIVSTAKAWCGEWSSSDPRVSPLLYDDLSILAKRGVQVHGIVGGYDILSPDAILFREKCDEAGIEGQWLVWDKQMHVFPLTFAFMLPEAVKAVDWMLDVLRKT